MHVSCGIWLPQGRQEEEAEPGMPTSSSKLVNDETYFTPGEGQLKWWREATVYTLIDIAPHERKYQEWEVCF